MKHSKINPISDIRHLGALLGSLKANRIIAVSTSTVFRDRSLLRTFWEIDHSSIDSGFQGHMYTRLNDILVVQVPYYDHSIPEIVTTSINANYKIWKSLTGIEVSSSASGIVLATKEPVQHENSLFENVAWFEGGLLDAAIDRYHNNKEEALLVFVPNDQFAEKLQQDNLHYSSISERSQVTSFLMDKNNAMQVLHENGVYCARTYIFNENTETLNLLKKIPESSNYIFKPAGGAAGIGIFGNKDKGASLDMMLTHLSYLKKNNKLPVRFQIQEFLSGTLQGYTAYINEDRSFEIFEIHQQFINEEGRFTGGRWTYKNQAKHLENATVLYKQLAAIKEPRFYGLICLDIIDNKIIEVNPRITASAPITHLLRYQHKLKQKAGNNFTIHQIDINTGVKIPYEFFSSGKLQQLIELTWKQNGMMVLPQGINPFGNSRLIFINDNEEGTGQQTFIQNIRN